LSLKAVSFLVLLSPACAASAGSKTVKSEFPSGDKTLPELESVAGPIVKAVVDRLKDANTTDSADKKKTIAQIIDAALEQEFPEEKEEAIGGTTTRQPKTPMYVALLCLMHQQLLLAILATSRL